MFRNKLLFLAVALTSLLLVSCSDDPSSIGADLLNPDKVDIKEINSFDDSLSQFSKYFKRTIPLGSSSRLLIGKTDSLEAVSLIRFRFVSLAESLRTAIKNNNLTIESATVELTQKYKFGSTSNSFDFSAHKINSNWTTVGFTADSLSSLNYDPSDASSNKSITDTLITFSLDKQLVREWLLAEADTVIPIDQGIYLKSASVLGIRGFQAAASNNAEVPILKVTVITASSDTAKLNFISIADLSVVTGTIPNLDNQIVVQSGLISNAKLWYDVASLPASALINSATLTLTLDTLMTKTGTSFNNSIRLGFFTDSTNLAIDSARTFTLTRDGNNFTGNITSFVQRWINGESNQGMLLWAAGQLEGVERFVFFGSSNSDRSKQPKLTITYTYKKSL